MQEILKGLRKIQVTKGWSDSQLARELGISPANLSMVKKGTRSLSAKTAGLIGKRFPELQLVCTNYIMS